MEAHDWVQIASAAVLALTAIGIFGQAHYSRKLVAATISSFVEGNVQLSLVPYGGQGALNLRVSNVGASVANDVLLDFPCGLLRTTDTGIENLVESGLVPLDLGSLGPGEKREWFLLNTTHALFDELPRFLPYNVHYTVTTSRGPKISSGRFDLHSYRGSLVRAFVNLDDICRTLERSAKAQGCIAKALKNSNEALRTSPEMKTTSPD